MGGFRSVAVKLAYGNLIPSGMRCPLGSGVRGRDGVYSEGWLAARRIAKTSHGEGESHFCSSRPVDVKRSGYHHAVIRHLLEPSSYGSTTSRSSLYGEHEEEVERWRYPFT